MVRPYDPKDVNVIIAGVIVTGYAEGDMVTCERNEDRITPYVGAKGETAYAVNNNNSGKITLTLQQASPTNKHLSNLSRAKNAFPVQVVDANTGGFKAGGNEAIVQKDPPIGRGKEIKDRAWEIWVGDYEQVE